MVGFIFQPVRHHVPISHRFPQYQGGMNMSVAKVTEIIASSTKSFDDAIKAGVERANKTLKNVMGAWIQDQKVVVDGGKITEYRVTMKVTFVLKS
jgi:dodecin